MVKDGLDVTMNCDGPGDIVPKIDINNRTFKKRQHAKYHRLIYQNIRKVMIKYLAVEVFRKLNHFSVRGGLSPYYSTQSILDQKPLVSNKQCTIPFGAFVQENNDINPTNSNVLRTIDGIYLQP